jgi:glycosyltransferase involved in cell wall biosynthesis
MASGLPVIVSANTGYTDTVTEGREGFIVPIRDPLAIAARIAQLQDNPELVREMGFYARSCAERFTWERYGDILNSTYRALIRGTDG